jgi:hypothetical protein
LPARQDRRGSQHAVAAGIYGLVVTASVMATAGERGSVVRVAISVVVAVVVYWIAEVYSDVLAHHLVERHHVTLDDLRVLLRERAMLVEASAVPLVVAILVRVVGAGVDVAVTSGLVTATVLLACLGWTAAARAGSARRVCVLAAVVTGCFGLVMIGLKTLIH